MIFKPSKCFVMNISNKFQHNISKFTYTIKDSPLSIVKTHTYLGVEIDNKLTWTPHCSKVKKKASQALGLIQRTLHAAPRSCKETAFKALVKPKLEYASTAWSPQTPGKKKLLESVQRKAARFVTREYSRAVKSDDIVRELKWDTLETRRNTNDVVMFYKIHHQIVQLPFPPSVVPKPRLAQHDHELVYLHVRPRIDAYRHSFFVRSIIMWNSLPSAAVTASSLQGFQPLALAHFRARAGVAV